MRLHIIAVVGLLSIAAANAGQIQLGGTNGLTSNYITQGAGAVCAAGAGSCLAGTTTGFVERNYDNRLFEGATESGTPPLPYSTYNQTATAAGTLGPFNMINDGTTGGNSNNYWNAGGGNQTMIVPVGIANVTDVQTMLNDLWGGAGANDTVVTFDFGTSSNASTFNNVVVVDLQNAPSGTSGNSGGQIRSAIFCATTSVCTLANGSLASESTPTTTLNVNPANLIVDTQNLFGPGYNGGIPNTSSFFNTTGNTVLDAQDFLLSSLVDPSSTEFLVNIKVQELNGSAIGSGASQTALSAITVDTVPEPSTIMLFLSGLGAVGFAKFRKK